MRNRKKQQSAVRWVPVAKVLLLCLMIGLVGIGYVDQKNQLYILSSEYRTLEKTLAGLERKNAERLRTLDSIQSLTELEFRIRKMNLGLEPPQPDRVVRLIERNPLSSQSFREQIYADAEMALELTKTVR